MKTDAYRTETRKSGSLSFRVEWFTDESADAPWDQCDGYGIVSDWENRTKRPGELILCSDRSMHRFYDFAETIKIARRDGWDTEPFKTRKPGERAHAATMADYEYLRAWLANEWWYCGIAVTLLNADGKPDVDASLWSIEDGLSRMSEFHDEVIRDLIAECMAQISATIGE